MPTRHSQVDIDAAKTPLTRLVERAEQGEEIVITRDGRPVVRLVPYLTAPLGPRRPGALKGRVHIKPGYDEIDDEIARLFGTV